MSNDLVALIVDLRIYLDSTPQDGYYKEELRALQERIDAALTAQPTTNEMAIQQPLTNAPRSITQPTAQPSSVMVPVEQERMIFANALQRIIDFPIEGEEAAQLKLIAIEAFTAAAKEPK